MFLRILFALAWLACSVLSAAAPRVILVSWDGAGYELTWVRLFWNGEFGMSHSGKGSSHLTRLRWRPLTGTTLPSA